MLVPTQNPKDAIQTVMQNKVIEALSKCKCEVEINAEMTLDGEFKDPKISVAFLTPENNKPKTPEAPKPTLKPRDPEQLTTPRV